MKAQAFFVWENSQFSTKLIKIPTTSIKVKIISNYSGDLALHYEILRFLRLYVGPYVRVLMLLTIGILTLTVTRCGHKYLRTPHEWAGM